MKDDKTTFISLFWVLLGLGLIVLGIVLPMDAIWSGLGGGLLAVGGLQLLRRLRYHRSEDYREKVDIAVSDERNQFLSDRAWSLAGRLFVVLVGLASVVLAALGRKEFLQVMGLSVGALTALYWLSWCYLRRKY